MSLLKQKRPDFKTAQEVKNHIKQKEEALQFWSSLKTVNMSDIVNNLRKDIEESKRILADYK